MESEEIPGPSDKGKGKGMVFDWSLKKLSHFMGYRGLNFSWAVTGKILLKKLVKN